MLDAQVDDHVHNMHDSSNLFMPANRASRLFMLYAQVDDHGVQYV